MEIIQIRGEQLRQLVDEIVNRETGDGFGIVSLRINVREGGVAIKINEGTWSPTLGEVQS